MLEPSDSPGTVATPRAPSSAKARTDTEFVAEDAAGNRASSPNNTVYVSLQSLVNKTVSYTENGNEGHLVTSDSSCTSYSYTLSNFTSGLWLDNVCEQPIDGFQAISAAFDFSVPAAVRYNAVEVQSYGTTINAPEPVSALIYDSSTDTDDLVGTTSVTQYDTGTLSTYGTVSASGRVDGGHVVVGIVVPDSNGFLSEDYDIGEIGITVSYQVLQ